MKRLLPFFILGVLLRTTSAGAFCGFYVAKADASLYNQASQVVYVREDNKNVLTLFNDFKGKPSEFALVVPVPEVLTKDQIHVGDRALVERVDAYSAPRLVEYFDPDPCHPWVLERAMKLQAPMGKSIGGAAARAKALGVSIEAQYTVGEYDILILGAKESGGLETWLTENGYHLPKGASKALEPYIKQSMKFFVAKVNLKEQAKSGFTYLRPIQFAFESPKFMLPIRLGMVNADGPQDLLVYVITRKGRVETTNYRTVKLPSGQDVPLYIKDKFKDFYRDLFNVADEKEDRKVVFLEYAWNMGWCDPCAADPMSRDELRRLGVFWLDDPPAATSPGAPGGAPRAQRLAFPPGVRYLPTEAFLTRLHVRYDSKHFPEDLFFQETSNTENFQGRYVLRHPWTQEVKCDQGKQYRNSIKDRWEKEADNLASLTGWKIGDIRAQMKEETRALDGVAEDKGTSVPSTDSQSKEPKKWYDKIFK